jgi:hypothetical protein
MSFLLGRKESSADAEPYELNAEDLRHHLLVAGGPESGKTNTCWQLVGELSEHQMPFLILETQGKTFRKLTTGEEPIKAFSICDDAKDSIRFNPLRTAPHVRILNHIQSVVSLTTASFNLSVTASKVLEKALYAVYNNHGWNLFRNRNSRVKHAEGDESGGYPPEAYPTLLELLEFIESVAFANVLAGNPPQELVRAIDSLVLASSGAVFNTKASLPRDFFENRQLLVECDGISDVRNKCFFAAMLLLQLNEHYMKQLPDRQKPCVVIDDAIHLTYLMGLPGRRVGDDQKEDSWIPLSTLLGNLRRLEIPLVISMQASSKLSPDLIALFGTRIFHRIDVQQARQISNSLPEDLEEKELYKCPVGSAWVVGQDNSRSELVRIPKHEIPTRDNSLAYIAASTQNCRFAGCSSWPGACEDDTFVKAREIAESQAFRTIYVDYFLSCQKDLTQLVHFRGRLVGELQSQIGRKFPDIVELSWCTICQATEWYFDKLAREHGWSYSDLHDQKERWFSMLRPAFLPDWPTRRINIDDLRTWREDFWKLKERDQGPLPLCGGCDCKCRYGSDVEHILRDPRNENDFFKSLSGDREPLSKAAAWFCWLFSERVMGEADIDLAYCLSAHLLNRANLSIDAQLVFAHKTRTYLEEAKLKAESGEPLFTEPETKTEETEKEARRRRSRERRKNRPDGDEPPLKPVP